MAKDSQVELEQLILLEDEPVRSYKTDELSLLPFSKVIAGAALGTGGPFTIGVFGGWGTGKTSVLKQAKTLLEQFQAKDKDVVPVWFNAWQFENEEHPIASLVASILHAVELKLSADKKTPKKKRTRFEKVLRFLTSILYPAKFKFRAESTEIAPAKIGGEIEYSFKDLIDNWKKQTNLDGALQSKSIVQDAIEDLNRVPGVGENKSKWPPYRIVVFIDDLDRCLPDNGLKVLESIKLVLAQPGFIFVLAVDRRVIESYLRKRYRDEFGVEDYEHSETPYLDKIVQLPFDLPSHATRFKSYVEGLMERESMKVRSNQPIREAILKLTNVLAIGTDYNPRRLVRIINNLIVDRAIWHSLGNKKIDSYFLGLCAITRILREHLKGEYDYLVQSQPLCDALLTVADLAKLESDLGGETSPGKSLSELARRTGRLIGLLQRKVFIHQLLKTVSGRMWLENEQQRKEVNDFIAKHREEGRPEAMTDREIIEVAIRRHMGLNEAALVTDQHRSRVSFLDLSNSPISSDGLANLRGSASLQRLVLSGCKVFGDDGMSHLSGLVSLKELFLSGCTSISDDGLAYLSQLTALEELDLNKCIGIGDHGLACLKNLKALQKLNLDECPKISNDGLAHLRALPLLQILSLDGCGAIDDAGLVNMRDLALLRIISLCNCIRINGQGFSHLSSLKHFERLFLDNCTAITVNGLRILTGIESLKYIHLDGCTLINNDGLAQLGRMEWLVVLSLRGCHLFDADGLSNLKRLQWLQKLVLDSCSGITDRGLAHLADLGNLQSLELRGCTGISSDGLAHLKGLTSLQFLDLRECSRLRTTAIEDLQNTLSKCRILRS